MPSYLVNELNLTHRKYLAKYSILKVASRHCVKSISIGLLEVESMSS